MRNRYRHATRNRHLDRTPAAPTAEQQEAYATAYARACANAGITYRTGPRAGEQRAHCGVSASGLYRAVPSLI